MKSFAIIGTGAIGGYLATKLHQAGYNTHCLLKSDYHHVKRYGLTIFFEHPQSVTAHIPSYQSVDDMPTCDVILVTTKSSANLHLREWLPKLMHEKTLVVLLQNGIGVEQLLAEYIPAHRIIGGTCFIKASRFLPGMIQHFGFEKIDIAQYYHDGRYHVSDSVAELANIFNKAGFNCTVFAHLSTLRWKKLVINIPSSGLSILFNANTKDLIANEQCKALLVAISKEIIETAGKCGADIPNNFFESIQSGIESLGKLSTNYVSMKEDFDSNRPLELDITYENALKIAREHGLSMPLTEKLHEIIQSLHANHAEDKIVKAREEFLSYYEDVSAENNFTCRIKSKL